MLYEVITNLCIVLQHRKAGRFLCCVRSSRNNFVQHTLYEVIRTSGTDGAFSITSNTSSSVAERTAVKTAVGYDSLSTANQATVNEQLNDYRNAILAGDTDAEVTAEDAVTEIALQTITDRVESETEATYRAGLASESDFSQTELDQLISDALASQSVVDELV